MPFLSKLFSGSHSFGTLLLSNGTHLKLKTHPTISNAAVIENTSVFVFKTVLRQASEGVYRLNYSADRVGFLEQFIADWRINNAFWYRGIPGCHWTWNEIRTYQPIRSEGDAIEPSFTMGGGSKTRWLPGDVLYEVAPLASIQCLAEVNPPLDLRKRFPISLVVKVKLGPQNPIPACFMPGSEVQVMGPLPIENCAAFQLIWMNFDTRKYLISSCRPENLPPERPFLDARISVSDPGKYARLERYLYGWYDVVRGWRSAHEYSPVSLAPAILESIGGMLE